MIEISRRHAASIFLVVDLSLLRGETREAYLAKLTSVISRTWMCVSRDCHGGDMTFGFSVYDSHVGGYMLSYQLNMVAQGMGIPTSVATTTGCDLNGDDLINFLTLITLVTDKNVIEELNLRTSRSSRSSDIPAVETSKVLHTILKSPWMHKIQKASAGDSSSSDDLHYGYLLIFTPSVGAKDVLHGYVGKAAMEETGCIEKAFLKHLPLTLWKSIGSHRISCTWISGNSEEESQGILDVIEARIQETLACFCMKSLDALSSPNISCEEFGSTIGFKFDEVTSSISLKGTISTVDAFWGNGRSHSSIEFLQTSLAGMRPSQQCITPLKTKSLKLKRGGQNERGTSKIRKKAMVGRGKRAMKNAHDAHKSSDKPDSRGACQHTNSTVNQQHDVEEEYKFKDVNPMNVSEAIEFASQKVTGLKKKMLELVKHAGKNDVSIAQKALKGVQSTIAESFKSVQKYYSMHSLDFHLKEVRSSFLESIPVAIPDLQKMHKATTFEKNYTVSWTVTIELLLRLGIASYSMTKEDGPSEGMRTSEYAAVEDAMHIIVATMSPIPSQGHTLFLKVIQPAFYSVLECDIKELEKAIWDEEDIAVDGDGALVDYQLAAASLEESGETLGDSHGTVQPTKHKSSKMQSKQVPAHAKVAACMEPSMSNSHGPACSGDGSGIQGGGVVTATISAARSKLSQSNLVSRRFNNSKQYGMQVRANRLKPRNKPGATKKQVPNPQKVQTKEQVPDTPQVHKTGIESNPIVCSTPDTGIVKQGRDDVIPNTSPREDSGRPKHSSRIGSIRQPLFEDRNAPRDLQNENLVKADDTQNEKGTWLSGALVKRKRGANSIASRMGEMNDRNSSESPTDVLDKKEGNREIMSPLKPIKPPREHDILYDGGDGDAYVAQQDLHDPSCEDGRHACHVEVILPMVTPIEHLAGHVEEAADHITANYQGRQSGDAEEHPSGIRSTLDAKFNDDACDPMDQYSQNSDSLFDVRRSDDEDSMAAKNECAKSEDSSEQVCPDDGITSPSGANKENIDQGDVTPKKLPLSVFDVQATPLVKSDIDNKKKRNPKAGRLAKMLAGPSTGQLQTTPPTMHTNQRQGSPGSRSITVEDRGSPCKPSPGFRSFGSLPKMQSASGTPDYSSDTDSCAGDSPDVVIAMKPLIHGAEENDSDEEDAAILNAAANGGLSPSGEEGKQTTAVRRKRRRSLLAATKGLIDVDARKKGKQSSKQPLQTPKQPTAEEDEKPAKQVQLHLTNPPVQKKKCVRKTSLPKKRNKMRQMPLEGEEVICSLTLEGQPQQAHCTITKICEAQLRGTKGWICHVEVVPIQTKMVESIKVKLDSSKEGDVGSLLDGPGAWCRVEAASPQNPKIVAALPSETAVHKAAVHVSGDILRQESMTILKASETHGAVVLSSPRRKLQPCTLKYDGQVLASAEKMTPPENLVQSKYEDMKGVELFPETVQPSPGTHVSPEARATAGTMLGSLYPHLNPVVSSKVVEILSSPLGSR